MKRMYGGPYVWGHSNAENFATLMIDSEGIVSYDSPSTGVEEGNFYIASGQGFLANVTSDGSVIFNNSMRVTGNNDNFKNQETTPETTIDRFSQDKKPLSRQILVGFHGGATDGYQNGQDGQSKKGSNTTDFYSFIPNDSRHFIIQNLATFNETKTVALGINIIEAGEYIFTINNMKGIFETKQDIYLKDNRTSTLHNLSNKEYVFTVTDTELGEINNRFELRFIDSVDANEGSIIDGIAIYPNPSTSIFNILWNGTANASIEVYDLAGKLIKTENLKQGTNTYQLDLSGYDKGFYFAKIQLDGQQVIKKLVLR